VAKTPRRKVPFGNMVGLSFRACRRGVRSTSLLKPGVDQGSVGVTRGPPPTAAAARRAPGLAHQAHGLRAALPPFHRQGHLSGVAAQTLPEGAEDKWSSLLGRLASLLAAMQSRGQCGSRLIRVACHAGTQLLAKALTRIKAVTRRKTPASVGGV
jgi:hypothetical protein